MKSVILCGGYGTRIRDVSSEIPKPMLPIGGHPILWHIMKMYSHYECREFVLCLGYQSQLIKQFAMNLHTAFRDVTVLPGGTVEPHGSENSDEDQWRITLAETGLDTMTGGRIRRIRKYVEDDEFFTLTYGDGVSDLPISDLIDYHKSHDSAVTVTGVHPPGRFGELTIGDDKRVIGFNEKPQVSGGRISGGFFVCSKRVFDYLDDRDDLVFEQQPLKSLAEDGQLRVYEHDGFWQPMDTQRDYLFLNKLWESGEAPWKTWS